MEILPVKHLTDEDRPIFGNLNVQLGALARAGFPVAQSLIAAAPSLKLKTTLEHFDFGSKEILEQTLSLVKKEIAKIPPPADLEAEIGKHKKFWLNGQEIVSAKKLWITLLEIWLGQIKQRIWQDGFYPGVTENLTPQIIVLASRQIPSFGEAYFDPNLEDVVISVKKGKLHPNDQKNIYELVLKLKNKLFGEYCFGWVLDQQIKLVRLSHLTVKSAVPVNLMPAPVSNAKKKKEAARSAVKAFVDLSAGLTIETGADGIFLDSGKIYDLDKPQSSFDNLVLKLVELAITFADKLILFKLADVKEGMGGIRGALRLLHQQSLFNPLVEVVSFARHKRGLTNISLVLPFLRSPQELLQLKRELAVKKLSRSHSLKYWLELAVPENILNLENYLTIGIDGVVINLDELLSHLAGFDLAREELAFYKQEISTLIKFLDEPFKVLHKAGLPVVGYGSLSLNPEILEFLVEKGIYAVVVAKYESPSAKEILSQVEKRLVLRRAQ